MSIRARPVNGSVWPRMLVPLVDVDGVPAAALVAVLETPAVTERAGEAELVLELDLELACVAADAAADDVAAFESGVRDAPAAVLLAPGSPDAAVAAPVVPGVPSVGVVPVVGDVPVGVDETTVPVPGDAGERPPNWSTPVEPVALFPPPT
jgi:hypothetical protein